jgi:hypothetical protein
MTMTTKFLERVTRSSGAIREFTTFHRRGNSTTGVGVCLAGLPLPAVTMNKIWRPTDAETAARAGGLPGWFASARGDDDH